jgi:hypothetical protein
MKKIEGLSFPETVAIGMLFALVVVLITGFIMVRIHN